MSPTQSVWFERFALGCLRRMGQDVHQDWAISLPAMQALMQLFEEEWSAAQDFVQQDVSIHVYSEHSSSILKET
jgi:hypothetical protein